MSSGPKHPPVAIIGISALFPDSVGARGFWQNIVDGRDLITDVPPSHWLIDDYYDPEPGEADKTYCKRGGFLPEIDFDPLAYGIPPTIIPSTDTTQLLALIAAKQVLEDAFEAQFKTMDKSKMSIVLGVTAGQELLIQAAARLQRPQWLAGLREHGIAEDQAQKICDRIADKYTPWQENTFPGLLGNVVAGRIANRFDLGGTNCITDAACASSLSALSMGLNELYLGHSDVVLTGGVDCFNDIFMYMCFTKTPALSRSEDCRPFADGADGTLMGEGLGMFALKRLTDAEAAGDSIYGVIKGLGSSSDGRSLSVYAPLPQGQAEAIIRAQERAGVDPSTIELVESHGTATKAGDVAEFKGLRHAFGADEKVDQPWCALGSIKSQIGHTKAAAGAAGLFKVAMALHHKVLPPTIKVDRPNPKLAIDASPFYLNTEARPWIRGADHLRRAGISSFGFGGSNFHVVLEEYDGPGQRPDKTRTLSSELFVYSAPSAQALQKGLKAQVDALQERPARREQRRELVAFMAHRSQQAFDASQAHRLSFVAGDLDELARNLEEATGRLTGDAPEEFSLPTGLTYRQGTRHAGDLAFLFPGQGSQYVGMGAELAMHFDVARQVWDGAADLGFALHQKVFPRPAFDEETIKTQQAAVTATEIAQPAIGAASAAQLALLNRMGLQADALAGHSYGEVTALFAGGAFDERTMLQVARKRGLLMADAADSTSGAMTAVRVDAQRLRQLLEVWGGDGNVTIANDNSPTQVVISGPTEAIEAAEAFLEARHIAFQRLPVDTAFHSPVVAAATEPFAEFLDGLDLQSPTTRVYANVTAEVYDGDVAETLTKQIENPVRFVEMVRAMSDDGVGTFVEVGPGSVLSRLTKRCLTDAKPQVIALDHRGQDGVRAFFKGLAMLSALGIELDFAPLWTGYGDPEDPRRRQPSKFTVRVNGANIDRPYPPPGGPGEVPPPNRPATTAKSPPPNTSYPNGSTDQDTTMSDDQKYTNGHYPTGQYLNGQQGDGKTAPAPPAPQAPARQPARQPASPASANAFAAYQQSLADSHLAYLKLMEESVANAQMAYMQAMESSFRQWVGDSAMASNSEAPLSLASLDSSPRAGSEAAMAINSDRSPRAGSEAAMAINSDRSPQAGSEAAMASNSEAPLSLASLDSSPRAGSEAAMAINSDSSPRAGSEDIQQIFLAVVADKTGYPIDMLSDDLALEADLGIDSIKRVEILSAVQDEVPSLPEVDPNQMAALKTLGEISNYLVGQNTGAAGSDVAMTRSSDAPLRRGLRDSSPPAAGGDLQQIFLTVVADKTGYPVDMLGDDLALEADLGIDSIKRVEILSAVQDEVPSLPELDPNQMASLKTLGEIIGYLESSGASEAGGQRLGKPKPSAATAPRPERYVPGLVAAPSAGLNMLTTSTITVIDDDSGVGAALARELAARGYPTTLSDDLDGPAQQVIDLRGLTTVQTIDDALAIQKAAFDGARTLAGEAETYVVVFGTGGNFGLGDHPVQGPQAWLGGLSALAKTANLEWEDTALKAIDLATEGVADKVLARRIADELTAGGPQVEVAYDAQGRRWTVASTTVVDDDRRIDAGLDETDIVVASGGARGVTADCLIELARRHQPAIILLGRTALKEESPATTAAFTDGEIKKALIEHARHHGELPKPAEIGRQAAQILKFREIRQTLAAIESAGSTVRYMAADVRDREALNAALDEVRRDLGAPTAIVHAAGVLADKFIADKTDDQFDFVFDTKVDGLRALLEVTRDDPVDHLCCFSSVAARTGNVGQVDYAMANETLNKVAAAEGARRGIRALSLNWGPWDGGMVDDSLRAHFEARGVALISPAGGAAVFCDTLTSSANNAVTEIVVGDGLPEATGAIKAPVVIDAISHPELAGHRVNDIVVVPAMVVADLFAGLARSLSGSDVVELRDLEVLKGIQLADFATSTRLIASASPVDSGAWRLELHSRDGTPRYRALASIADEGAPTPLSVETNGDSDWSADRIYRELLFHRDQFAVIDEVQEFSERSARAALKPTAASIALDAALQLVLAQGAVADGRSNLPTRIAHFSDLGIHAAQGALTIVSRLNELTGHKTVSDVDFIDDAGHLRATLRGLEMFFFGEPLLNKKPSHCSPPLHGISQDAKITTAKGSTHS